MTEQKKSYRNVLKATSLFGGVQIVNILISIVRSKVIALLIGAAGMGIVGLLSSTLDLINGLTNLGLDRSAVKDISFDKNNSDQQKVYTTINILKRLVWFTITIGVLVMLFSAPLLSEIAFGNKGYTNSFRWISISLLFTQLSKSQLAILQGLQKLQSLAKANLLGNFIGLFITVPLYYFFNIDAIVPAIIIITFISFFISHYFVKKEEIPTIKLTNKQVFVEGKEMIFLGAMLSFSSLLVILVAYLLRIYISNRSGINEVGLYTAGFLILNSYVGIIFNAMSTDYFPRLSAISNNIIKIREVALHQAIIAVLLIMPIIVLFLVFAPYIITILYSQEFTEITSMVRWGILGMVFKAASWTMGYIIFAKGDSKVFLKTAIGFNSIMLLFNIIGYNLKGLEGLGISLFLYYIFHFIAISLITYFRYTFYFKKYFYKIFFFSVLLCLFTFTCSFIENVYLRYAMSSVFMGLSLWYSYKELDKRIGLLSFVEQFIKKKKK